MENKNDIFGKRLKRLREHTGKNQEDVANAIGISRARYSHYENNHVEPDMDLIRKLADYYKVTTDYLLGRSNDVDLLTDEEIDQEIQEITKDLNVWYKDEPEDKREKLKMLRKIIKTFTEDN